MTRVGIEPTTSGHSHSHKLSRLIFQILLLLKIAFFVSKDQEKAKKSNYLLVPEAVENPVSPSASLTSSVSIGAAQSMTSGSSKQAQMSGNRRRRFSDVGVQRLPEPDVSFYNGRSYSDTEDQIQKVRVEMVSINYILQYVGYGRKLIQETP